MFKEFFRLWKSNRFTHRKARKVLRQIEKGKLDFDEAKREGIIPPLISSVSVLRRIVEDRVFVI